MTWDDTDRTELDKHIDEIEDNAYNLGVMVGKGLERDRIRNLAEDWVSEMRGHDGECNCKNDSNVLQRFIKHNEFNGVKDD